MFCTLWTAFGLALCQIYFSINVREIQIASQMLFGTHSLVAEVLHEILVLCSNFVGLKEDIDLWVKSVIGHGNTSFDLK